MSDDRERSRAVTFSDDLAEHECRQFDLPGERSGFVLRYRGELYAYLNQCPHLGIALNWQANQFMDADNCFIQCANHGALFTVEEGLCIAGPCSGDHLIPLMLRRTAGEISITVPDSGGDHR